MSTIKYDKPVRDFIKELSATGHVTHTKSKKKSVTIHHNAGRLSHQGVLDVWKVRPASAHFDVDGNGMISKNEASADAVLSAHFSKLDKDKDGSLSATELSAAKTKEK